jgi:hypothetical protein
MATAALSKFVRGLLLLIRARHRFARHLAKASVRVDDIVRERIDLVRPALERMGPSLKCPPRFVPASMIAIAATVMHKG